MNIESLKNRNTVLIIALIILALIIAALFILRCSSRVPGVSTRQQSLYEKDLKLLKQDITASDLEDLGYLNLTEVQDKRIGNVEQFFQQALAGEEATLKYFTKSEDNPLIVVYILYHAPGSPFITVLERELSFTEAASYRQLAISLRAVKVDRLYEIRAAYARAIPILEDSETASEFLLYRTRGLQETTLIVPKN